MSTRRSLMALGIDTGANTAWAFVDVPIRRWERPTVYAVGMLEREDRAGQLRELLSSGVDVADESLADRKLAEVVGIECVAQVYNRERFGAAMSTHLADSARIVGALQNECEHARVRTVVITASKWRKALLSDARANDKQIAHWMRLAVNCECRTNEHTRDAIGVAIYAARHVMTDLPPEEGS